MSYTREQVEAAVKSKGYVWFDDASNKGFDVNIVGIRNSATGQTVTNAFDDTLTISYKENGQWKFHSWSATTDPGKKGVLEYHNASGVARLVEGQYRGSHTIRLHQGKYEALGQAKNMKVYRDANKDMIYNESKIQEGVFGINIHKAGADSTYVENWSEGCQVFKKSTNFEEFMAICRKARDIHGNSFTYTLIESTDIK
jgi:predicted GNAT superfamily acetyltransferase